MEGLRAAILAAEGSRAAAVASVAAGIFAAVDAVRGESARLRLLLKELRAKIAAHETRVTWQARAPPAAPCLAGFGSGPRFRRPRLLPRATRCRGCPPMLPARIRPAGQRWPAGELGPRRGPLL